MIICVNGQWVQSMRPIDSCVPGTASLHCPPGYIVVPRTAFYGVARLDGSCVYQAGDCIADALNIALCLTDSETCGVYGSKRKLPQCNDQMSNYIHVEYDCVPKSMNDSSKEYTVCQDSTEITTAHGIIISPGYPKLNQTTATAECFRAIHVPSDKTIRLWLTDLYIGSTGVNCAQDHVNVIDSVQTYRFCGIKRYAYPYLCSSTIIIQFLVTTQLSTYRGMRMYFEVVDRLEDDGCANVNGTIPTTPDTTTTDIYVSLGIASPIRSFQLCKGQSYLLSCPNNYGIVITTNIFGVTDSDQCEQHDAVKACIVTTAPALLCRQSCTYFYSGNQIMPACKNKIAAYQYVEYQCIPTQSELIAPNTQCPADGSKVPIRINRRGRFQNFNYPTFRRMNCTYRLTSDLNTIMNIYALDISLNDYNPDCTSNKISFVGDDESDTLEVCEQRSYSLIYSTCSNEIDLRYVVNDETKLFSSGAQLYIESQTRPLNWACGKPLTTLTNPPVPTSPFTTPTATPLTNSSDQYSLPEFEYDICFGSSSYRTCPSGYTFMVISAYYGVKKLTSNQCGFVQGDCVQEALSTITQCRNDASGCFLAYSTKRRLAVCSDAYADYLHITGQCVPSKPIGTGSTLTVFDICDTNAIQSFNGIVTSPNFNSYTQTINQCKRTLIGVTERILKIWINEMAIASAGRQQMDDSPDEPNIVIHKSYDAKTLDEFEQMYPSIRDICINDYLIINAPHVAYVYCGTRKLALAPICAQQVDILYKTTSQPSIYFRGFKFYFEWTEKPPGTVCGGLLPSTTTPINEPLPDWAQNLDLSPILSEPVCLGTSKTLRCPRGSDYVLSIVETFYAVTGTGLCEVPSTSHCRQEASLSLSCTQSCFIEYDIPKQLSQCGSRYADYLNIDYECIPTRPQNDENPIDICAPTTTDTISMGSGIMTSPQYPTLGAPRSCSKRIETLPNKLWMIFIVDLFLKGQTDSGVCDEASLTIYDGNDTIVLCGLQEPKMIMISCSNIVEFRFASIKQTLGYRGFKVYFKTIDVPNNWQCTPSGFITTRRTTTVRPPTTTTLLPPSFQIATYGGTTNGTRQYCTLPFKYQGKLESSCLRRPPPILTPGQDNQDPWCSLTKDFDSDGQWGFCEIGVTDSTLYDICRGKTQSLKCPPGYVIDIITADYAAKPNGNIGNDSCIYAQSDCFQSDASTVQNTCAGKPSCIAVHFAKTLSSCQNRPSAYLHIDYTCIPKDIPDIPTYNMCDNSTLPQGNTRRGFIISAGFPNTQNNIDCTFNLQTSKPYQDIYLYIVEMDLNAPDSFGGSCAKDRLIVSDNNNIFEVCGKLLTNYLINTCHSSLSLQLIRTPTAKGNGVKLYFEFRDRDPNVPCTVITTSARPSTLSPPATTTAPLPIYYPDPSPRSIKNLCYPDYSGLFGGNNFQCPLNYVIVIHRALYGRGERCYYTPGDCTTEADNVYRQCAGKQGCSLSFLNQVNIPECNGIVAQYLFVEYQCLPTPAIVTYNEDLCSAQIDIITGISGILKSPSYPTYAPTQCANVTLALDDNPDLLMYMYLLDLDIGSPDPSTGECSNDYLQLSYQCNNQLYSQRLCGTRSTELLFSTCSITDKVFATYSLLNQDPQTQRGFALLYHFVPKAEIPETTLPVVTKTTTKLITTTKTIPPTPPGAGPVSTNIFLATTCVQESLRLQCALPGYVLVIHRVQLAAGAPGVCDYSSNDCFEDRTNQYTTCGGKTACFIFPPLIQMKSCNNSKSTYLYAEYQCIPIRPKVNLDICASANTVQRIDGAGIISSLNYTSEYKECKLQVQSNTLLGSQIHTGLKIYIFSMNLPKRATIREQGAQCGDNDPFVEIDDSESDLMRLCGNSDTRFLFETCSSVVRIRYQNFNLGTTGKKYKGFGIYVESIQNDKCRPVPPLEPPTSPFEITRKAACGLSNNFQSVHFGCTSEFGLVFLNSKYVVTKQPDQCDLTQSTCSYPAEQPQAKCSGQQTCLYAHPIPLVSPSNDCPDSQADSTEFYYQCLPMKPSSQFSQATFCYDLTTTDSRGFIETPAYPNTYQYGQLGCALTISLPSNNNGTRYSIYLYVIELSLLDTSILSTPGAIECLDSITYSDGVTTDTLCGKFEQPFLQFSTDQPSITLTFNKSQTLPASELNNWAGARLFYFIGNQALPTTSAPIDTTVTTTTTIRTTAKTTPIGQTEPTGKKPTNGGVIAAIIITVLVVLVGGFAGARYYRRRLALKQSTIPTITYDTTMTSINGLTVNGTSEKRPNILTKSFTGATPSTFTSPFYVKSSTNEKPETTNTTDA